MKHVITVSEVQPGDRVCVRIGNGHSTVADMFSLFFTKHLGTGIQIDDAVEILMKELESRVERRGEGLKGRGMKKRTWRVVCPACKVKSSVLGPEHQLLFRCPGCDFQTTIKDEGEGGC